MNYKNKRYYMKQFDSIFGTKTLKSIKFPNMKLLKRIFIYFMEDLYTPSKRYKKIRKESLEKIHELKQKITDEQIILLDKYCELNNMMVTEVEEQLFLFGCIVGMQLYSEMKIDK